MGALTAGLGNAAGAPRAIVLGVLVLLLVLLSTAPAFVALRANVDSATSPTGPDQPR